MSHRNSRISRAVAGIAVLSAFAAAPVVAQAADTDADGTLSGGALTNTAPAITPFTATLSGVAQNVSPVVGAWSVTDARGTNAGYTITASASAPTVAGTTGGAGTGATISLTSPTATAAAGNAAATGPVSTGAQLVTAGAVSIDTAAISTGQGQWNFAAAGAMTIVIPGNASAGAYHSTLTYTASALAV